MKTTHQSVSIENQASPRRAVRCGEGGYALLGLLLALSVMSIFLVSSVVPNVKMQVQRYKEEELIYRGNQMAKAIARYYGVRVLRPLQLQVPPPYGYLTELKKLSEGVTIGVQEIKFSRASEMIDPMTNVEWEPVHARDPRINGVLQAYSVETNWIITPAYSLLAGPPTKPHKINLGGSESDDSSDKKPNQPGSPPNVKPKQNNDPDADNDDTDDDDGELNDPLGHLFKSDSDSSFGKSNVPIVGVAPKLKGKAILPLRIGRTVLTGLDRYEDWVFLFIPDPAQGVGQNVPNQPQGPLKTSP